MSDRDEEEARAETWLHAQGYTPSRPTWLPPGRNPDFWAESATLAPQHLWAEVKSIDPDDGTAALYGLDGVFRQNKNTHVSAAVHVRREGSATFFPNPHARHPIPDNARVFAGAVRADVKFV